MFYAGVSSFFNHLRALRKGVLVDPDALVALKIYQITWVRVDKYQALPRLHFLETRLWQRAFDDHELVRLFKAGIWPETLARFSRTKRGVDPLDVARASVRAFWRAALWWGSFGLLGLACTFLAAYTGSLLAVFCSIVGCVLGVLILLHCAPDIAGPLMHNTFGARFSELLSYFGSDVRAVALMTQTQIQAEAKQILLDIAITAEAINGNSSPHARTYRMKCVAGSLRCEFDACVETFVALGILTPEEARYAHFRIKALRELKFKYRVRGS